MSVFRHGVNSDLIAYDRSRPQFCYHKRALSAIDPGIIAEALLAGLINSEALKPVKQEQNGWGLWDASLEPAGEQSLREKTSTVSYAMERQEE